MLETAVADLRIRVVIVGCSLGRGAADELSDVDALIGVPPKDWDAATADSSGWVTSWGDTIDLFQSVPDGARHQHTYALFTNGVELDLSVSPLRDDWRRRNDWVVLYDPERLVPDEVLPHAQSTADLRRWGYAALIRLSAVAKYVARGALWEAHLCLELARADVWRIWAVAEHVHDAQYGVTAIFDDPRRPVPPGMARTVATLDSGALTNAALACCDVFTAAWPRAIAALGGADDVPRLAGHVRERLRGLATG